MGKHSKQIDYMHVTCSHGELGVGLGLSRDSAGKYMSRGKGIRDNLGGGGAKYNLDYGYTFPLSCKEFHIIISCSNLNTNLNTGTPSQMQVTHTVTKIMYSCIPADTYNVTNFR